MRGSKIGSTAMDSSSRVKVEYRDPTGIHGGFVSELQSRLPLKELHWSPGSARPTRSVSNLHIELLPEDDTGRIKHTTSSEVVFGSQENESGTKGEPPRKERRHQIPGLRRTPYLKIYILQCSDVDTYKASSRKLLREWINAQSSPSKSKQENHDAFEWLIVHVVSVSPEVSKPPSSTRPEGNADKRPTSNRWPSRSSTSLIEKIRSDFNGTSKNAVDRVVQVQILQRPTGDAKYVNRLSQDGTNGWDDLLSKLKSLILASFDLRVSQYEEDIREKELQRNLPGWNFNTFFILKEGLARGFESVGLIEDALTGYHELSFGLKAAIDEEHTDDKPGQQTAHFSNYTEELYEAFKQAKSKVEGTCSAGQGSEKPEFDLGVSVLDTERKDFQDLILTNKISIFDFQCYLFARQASLTLRLANAVISPPDSTKAKSSGLMQGLNSVVSEDDTDLAKPSDTGPEDLLMLAEVTTIAAAFLTTTAVIIREDIKLAIQEAGAASPGHDSDPTIETIVDNIVCNWEFSASQRILEATSARSLSAQLDPLLRQLRSKTGPNINGSEKDIPDSINTVHRNGHPSRTSSLAAQGPAKPAPLSQESFPLVTSLDAVRLLPPGMSRVGAQEVAAQRGDLWALARRVLSGLGLRHSGWSGSLTDMASISLMKGEDLQEVELNSSADQDKKENQTPSSGPQAPIIAGICNKVLLAALDSSSDFYNLYERLTTSALACYVVGDRKKAAEAMTADLAVIRFQLKDYNVAASYFRQLAPFYAKDNWSNLEIVMLDMYAQCLGHLGKIEEHIRIALRTLAKTTQSTHISSKEPLIGIESTRGVRQPLADPKVGLKAILAASQVLSQPVSIPMEQYFECIRLDKHIEHSFEHDGFVLAVRMRSLLPEKFEAISVKARLVSVDDGQRSEIWLSADTVQMINPGMVKVTLISKMMLPGWYTLSSMAIQASNIVFMHDLTPTSNPTILTRPRDSMISRQRTLAGQHRLLIWARSSSLETRLAHYGSVNLDQPKSVKVEITSGSNKVSQGLLLLRAASAGLRLHTAEAVVEAGGVSIVDKSHSGIIGFGALSADSSACIRIPYDLESDLKEISVRAEVKYITPKGDFTYACNSTISVLLPLSISVQDIFKQDTLFAKFTIGTASSIPVRVFNCHLESNQDFQADLCPMTDTKYDIFALQPLSFISRIRHRFVEEETSDTRKPFQNKLYLQIDYRCLDQEICAAVDEAFSNHLSSTPFGAYERLLKLTLLTTLRTRVSMQDLDAIGLRREFDLGLFEDYGWATILAGLPTDHGGEIAKWLQSWHGDHRMIHLDAASKDSPLQHLIVPVEMPHMHVVHTARLGAIVKFKSLSSDSITLAIGEALPMELVIAHTRRWHNDNKQEANSQPLDFVYEVQASPDIWLIGGQRKGHFSANAGDTRTFSLLLYPQTTGHLMYPAIEIQSVPLNSEMSSETNDESQAESVNVVVDRMSSTVSLDPSSAGGGWLVESRSRKP